MICTYFKVQRQELTYWYNPLHLQLFQQAETIVDDCVVEVEACKIDHWKSSASWQTFSLAEMAAHNDSENSHMIWRYSASSRTTTKQPTSSSLPLEIVGAAMYMMVEGVVKVQSTTLFQPSSLSVLACFWHLAQFSDLPPPSNQLLLLFL